MKKFVMYSLIVCLFMFPLVSRAGILFQENFEDTNFSARGWYDGTHLILSAAEHIPGSAKSAEFHFLQGAISPTSGVVIRKKFTETDKVYLSYYVKYSANWAGSNKPYHPHEFLLLTNLNGAWDGPAFSHMTAYIEQNEGTPLLAVQDGQNIDKLKVGQDLTTITENRAVAGCNGVLKDDYTSVDCYPRGSNYYNAKKWKAGMVYFQDAPGPYYKHDWHFIEAFIKLNSVVNGKGVADGILQYWYDRQLIIDRQNLVLRTGQNPTMKFNQFLMGPYIGDGSPIDQTMWVDNLTVATSRVTQQVVSPLPPSSLVVK